MMLRSAFYTAAFFLCVYGLYLMAFHYMQFLEYLSDYWRWR